MTADKRAKEAGPAQKESTRLRESSGIPEPPDAEEPSVTCDQAGSIRAGRCRGAVPSVPTTEDHPPQQTRAPIAIFVYKRPYHSRRLIESLAANPEFDGSPIYVFCDGPVTENDHAAVEETRRVVKRLLPARAVVVERETNLGLAASVIDGIGTVLHDHDRIIVLEDDLVLSPYTLEYLNRALNRYEHTDTVSHVSAYMFPLPGRLPDSFFYREHSCWGWATWKRAWQGFRSDASALMDEIVERGLACDFDIGGTYCFTRMLYEQVRGRIDSWAIRWYASNFLSGRLALHPGLSLTVNTGLDGSGRHSSPSDASLYGGEPSNKPAGTLPDKIEEDPAVLEAMKSFRRSGRNLVQELRFRLRRLQILYFWKLGIRR